MPILQTVHQKKSFVITTVLMATILLLMFLFGLKYYDPPIEYGVAVNFGNSDFGQGPPVVDTAPTASEAEALEEVEDVSEEVEQTQEVSETETTEETLMQDSMSEQSVPEQDEVNQPSENNEAEEDIKEAEKENPQEKVVEKPKPKPKPKPSKQTTSALSSILNGKGKQNGEGDDNKKGVKGKETGDPKSKNYYNIGGSGGDGNYNLYGRKALKKPIYKPECNEEGKVVVEIEVDKSGRVIRAKAGVKGTTNSAPCLLKPAKEAALQTKWNPDTNAPHKQIGTIVYYFSLSE